MIRINLLPFRAERKKENIKRQITLFGLTISLAIVAMLGVFLYLNDAISGLKDEKTRLKSDLEKYDRTLKEIDGLKKQIKNLRAKLNVIKELKKKKQGPVLLLDEIAAAIPKDKLFLKSLKEKKGRLNLSGTAMDNETVALFMNNLESSKHIKSVNLKSTKLKKIKKYKVSVTEFALNCKTYAFKEKKKKKGKKRKKKRRR